MGNSIGGKKKTAKVMKIDGTTFRLKPQTNAGSVLRDYPGYSLLESEEVKQLGVRAKPLEPEATLNPGKLYFLVEIPRLPDPRRTWSGAIHVSAKERLESLMLSRRSVSDLSLAKTATDGTVRLRMKLPKAQVSKFMEESKDSVEAAEKIMELCLAKDGNTTETVPSAVKTGRKEIMPPAVKTGRKEKRTRFVATPDEIIA